MFPFKVDEESDLPIWVQLRQRIAYLINTGYFKEGEKLPTVRGLASEISINYNTVNKAYLSLVSDGYLESTRGRGVFVTDIGSKFDDEQMSQVESLIDDFIAACRELGMDYEDIEKALSRRVKKRSYESQLADGDESASGHIIEFEKAKQDSKSIASGA